MNVVPLKIWTDGSCLNNPGPGGVGFVIQYWEDKDGEMVMDQFEFSKGFRLSTSIRMEIMAGLFAIQESIGRIQSSTYKNISQIELHSDSEHFCNVINKRWLDNWQTKDWVKADGSKVKNRDLWEQIANVLQQLQSIGVGISIKHVPGHVGEPMNELSDKLAKSGSSGNQFDVDEVYESLKNKR